LVASSERRSFGRRSSPRAVIFDWDGTLVDSAEASFRCYVRMFEAFRIPFDRQTYARTYSPNWYDTFRAIRLPEEHWDEADVRWLAHFGEETIDLIDGARDAVRELVERGIDVAVVTSGSRDRVTRELNAHGLAPAIRECVFGSDVVRKKPHPDALFLCLQRLGIGAEDAVYVGDSPEDVAMARAAGVFSVAVPGRYPNREALLEANPDMVRPTLREAMRELLGSARSHEKARESQ
jgi:HAD superfamily hydrolase (TIGR01549 family)